MKARLLLLVAVLIPCCAGPLPCPAAPLTPAQVALVRDMEAKAAQAVADDAAAKQAEALEHADDLQAESDDATAKRAEQKEADKDAQDCARADKFQAEAAALQKTVSHLHWTLIFVVLGSLAATCAAGATLEAAFRWVLSALVSLIESVLSFVVTKLTMLWPPLGVPVNLALAAVRLLK